MPMQTGPDVLPSAAGGAGGACVVPAGPLPPKRTGPLKFMRYSNAYMLVYVRASDWGRIMCPVTKDDIAPYLRERLEVGFCCWGGLGFRVRVWRVFGGGWRGAASCVSRHKG